MGNMRSAQKILVVNIKGTELLGNTDVDGRIIGERGVIART
jgi:hypothetical protein